MLQHALHPKPSILDLSQKHMRAMAAPHQPNLSHPLAAHQSFALHCDSRHWPAVCRCPRASAQRLLAARPEHLSNEGDLPTAVQNYYGPLAHSAFAAGYLFASSSPPWMLYLSWHKNMHHSPTGRSLSPKVPSSRRSPKRPLKHRHPLLAHRARPVRQRRGYWSIEQGAEKHYSGAIAALPQPWIPRKLFIQSRTRYFQ